MVDHWGNSDRKLLALVNSQHVLETGAWIMKPTGRAKGGTPVTLRVLATTDLHMHLSDDPEPASLLGPQGGLVTLGALIAEKRAEVLNSVLLDNGDFLHGSSVGEAVAAACQAGGWTQDNPMIAAMNVLGYDAATLGNHEFSHGVPFLAKALSTAQFPLVSANCGFVDQDMVRIRRSVILEKHVVDATGARRTLRIGVTGGLPPQTAAWDKQAIAGQVQIGSMALALEAEARALRQAGADVVIVLAHSGIGSPDETDLAEHCALRVARSEYVDAIVLGHIHLAFPGPDIPEVPGWVDPANGRLAGKPAIMAGARGSHLGVIDLALSIDAKGKWIVERGTASLSQAQTDAKVPASSTTESLRTIAGRAQDLTRDWAKETIGEVLHPLHSYFALICDCPSVELVNRAQTAYVAQQLAGTEYADLPVVSATAPYRSGGHDGVQNFFHLPPGPIQRSDATELYVHPNTIAALHVTGAELRHWLETSAQVFSRLLPGVTDQMLLDPSYPGYHFDIVHGVEYKIDLMADARQGRITSLRRGGVPVADDDQFILATNSYRISGSGGFLKNDPKVVLADRMSNRDVLMRYIRQNSPIEFDMPRPRNWKLSAAGRVRAVFETSPLAKDCLWQITHYDPEVIGLSPKGFLRVAITI